MGLDTGKVEKPCHRSIITWNLSPSGTNCCLLANCVAVTRWHSAPKSFESYWILRDNLHIYGWLVDEFIDSLCAMIRKDPSSVSDGLSTPLVYFIHGDLCDLIQVLLWVYFDLVSFSPVLTYSSYSAYAILSLSLSCVSRCLMNDLRLDWSEYART